MTSRSERAPGRCDYCTFTPGVGHNPACPYHRFHEKHGAGSLERFEDAHGVPRTPDLSIHQHVALAERHAQRALDLAYKDEPQGLRVRWELGKAQSLLISLITNGRLR